MREVSAVDKAFLGMVIEKFLRSYENQKQLLACNTSPPTERNAYFSLSNAIYGAAGRSSVIAATEVTLKNRRRVDAVFVVGRTMYMVELKITTARIKPSHLSDMVEHKKLKFSQSTEITKDICTQLDGIDGNSDFIRNAINDESLSIKKIICAGLVVGNIRVSETSINIKNIKRREVTSFGEQWLSATSFYLPKKYIVAATSIRPSKPKRRTNRSGKIQLEIGAAAIICARVIKEVL